jgi:Na+/H+ antiporter NhaD/arsenite permease-like protein
MSENAAFWLTLLIFSLTYLGLAAGKVPRLRMDRAGIAWVGAALILASGLLTFPQAVEAIDFATIALLLGMMVVVGFLKLANFFDRLAAWALTRVRTPLALLAATMFLSGTLSAFLVNDVVCVALTPLVLHLTMRLRLDPRPHLIGLAIASNLGSTATLTGNPQNMIIGNLSGISYLRFIARLGPIAVMGLAVGFIVVAWMYRDALKAPTSDTSVNNAENGMPPPRYAHSRLLIKSLVVTIGAVVGFFSGAPLAVVALVAAGVLLLGRVNPPKVYAQIDWRLLIMFAGLFVVVHAFEVHVARRWGVENWEALRESPVGLLSLLSAGLSNLVSNVPAVLLFKPVIPALPAELQETAWLALAMSSTLAGNLTVLGSVANLIVVEIARREGTSIGFVDYLKVGMPVTVLTLAIGVAWLQWVSY